LDLDGIGPEIDADGRALGFAGLVIEAAVMLGTFDDVVHHQPVGEMDLLVRAEPVGGVIGVLRAAVDREGASVVIETDHVFLIDLPGVANLDPVIAHGHLLQSVSVSPAGYSAACATGSA